MHSHKALTYPTSPPFIGLLSQWAMGIAPWLALFNHCGSNGNSLTGVFRWQLGQNKLNCLVKELWWMLPPLQQTRKKGPKSSSSSWGRWLPKLSGWPPSVSSEPALVVASGHTQTNREINHTAPKPTEVHLWTLLLLSYLFRLLFQTQLLRVLLSSSRLWDQKKDTLITDAGRRRTRLYWTRDTVEI